MLKQNRNDLKREKESCNDAHVLCIFGVFIFPFCDGFEKFVNGKIAWWRGEKRYDVGNKGNNTKNAFLFSDENFLIVFNDTDVSQSVAPDNLIGLERFI